ncbi:MAG: hypothetical protein ACN6I4_01565 [bacterium]
MKTRLFTLLIASLLTFSNCKKEEDNTPISSSPSTPTSSTNMKLLTNGTVKGWKFISSKFNGNDITQECEKDDVYAFNTNGNYIVHTNANKCSSNEPDEVANTWEFNNDEKEITWVTGFGTFEMKIIELTETRLKVKQETNVVFELTFEAE